MNETMICAVGNVATQPVYRELATGASVRFRLAASARYLDREKNEWTDGHTNFFTVWANRQLATNVSGSINVGDPVVVHGRLKVRSEGRGAAGLDLGRHRRGGDRPRPRARHLGLPAHTAAGEHRRGFVRAARAGLGDTAG